MSKRSQHLYQFTGTIYSRTLRQASPTSKYANQEYYHLRIVASHRPPQAIQVFADKLKNPTIWEILQQAQWGELSSKKFTFHCRNVRGYYHLID